MGKRKFVAFDVDDTLVLLEGKNKDKIKNPHRLLPLMLFMGNSPDHEMAMLTNRGEREEGFGLKAGETKDGLSTLEFQAVLRDLGIKIDDSDVIRQPNEYKQWTNDANLAYEIDLYLKNDSAYPGLKTQKQDLQAKIKANDNKIKNYEAANPRPHASDVAHTILGYQDISTDLRKQLQAIENQIYAKYSEQKKASSPDARKAIETQVEKKFGGKNIRLEQLRQRSNIKQGAQTAMADTIMVDDNPGVIEGTKMAGYGAVKATERGPGDDNSDYVKELGQKIGLDEYLDDLVKYPTMHLNDHPMQIVGALMYGIQTREDFKPSLLDNLKTKAPYSDFLKRLSYSEKQQVKAMIQYIKNNAPEGQKVADFKQFVASMPLDSVAKKNEQSRLQENEKFLKEAPGKFRALLSQYDASKQIDNEVVCEGIVSDIEEMRQRIRALMKDNNPQIRFAAKALSEQVFEHVALNKSQLKEVDRLQRQLSTGITVSDKELHSLQTVLSQSVNLEVRSKANAAIRDNAALFDKAIIRDLQTAYNNAKGDDNKISALVKELNVYARLQGKSAIKDAAEAMLDTINDEIKRKTANPTQLAVLDLKRDLKAALSQEQEQGYGKALINRFFEDVNLDSISSVKKHIHILKRDIENIEKNPNIKIKPDSAIVQEMRQAVDNFTQRIFAIEGPPTAATRTVPKAPPVVQAVKALNEQSNIKWEIKFASSGDNQTKTQIWSPPMSAEKAKQLLAQLNKGLEATVISSTQDEGKCRVTIKASKAEDVLKSQQRFTAPPPPKEPERRPPTVTYAATLSRTSSSALPPPPEQAPKAKEKEKDRSTPRSNR